MTQYMSNTTIIHLPAAYVAVTKKTITYNIISYERT